MRQDKAWYFIPFYSRHYIKIEQNSLVTEWMWHVKRGIYCWQRCSRLLYKSITCTNPSNEYNSLAFLMFYLFASFYFLFLFWGKGDWRLKMTVCSKYYQKKTKHQSLLSIKLMKFCICTHKHIRFAIISLSFKKKRRNTIEIISLDSLKSFWTSLTLRCESRILFFNHNIISLFLQHNSSNLQRHFKEI